LLLHGHPPELLGTGARIIAGLLEQLGLAVAVGGKDYANVSQTRTERLVLSLVEVSRSESKCDPSCCIHISSKYYCRHLRGLPAHRLQR
jgi:hypothetical protein